MPVAPRTAAWDVRLLAALLLSTGCAQLPVETGPADFRVEGKVGVLEGERSHAARFVWRQTGDRYDIVLWGPLGQGSTRLRGDSDRIEITGRSAGTTLSGEPGTVMRRAAGLEPAACGVALVDVRPPGALWGRRGVRA